MNRYFSQRGAFLLITVALAGCAPDSTASPDAAPVSDAALTVPLESLGAELRRATCTRLFEDCCTPADIESIRRGLGVPETLEACLADVERFNDLIRSDLEERTSSGELRYDGVQARACLDAFARVECRALVGTIVSSFPSSPGPFELRECQGVVTGRVPLGGACNDTTRPCETGQCSSGVCVARATISQPCWALGPYCEAGLFCDRETGRCEASGEPLGARCGRPDECASGWCDANALACVAVCGGR